MVYKKIAYLALGMIFYCFFAHGESFLIEKNSTSTAKKWSRNKLREQIAGQVKDVFTTTTGLLQELGSVQVMLSSNKFSTVQVAEIVEKNGKILQEISSLQNLCTRVLEGLLDNHIIFKKTEKKELEAMHERVALCSAVLKNRHEMVMKCTSNPIIMDQKKEDILLLKRDRFLTKCLNSCLDELTKHVAVLKNDGCVKSL